MMRAGMWVLGILLCVAAFNKFMNSLVPQPEVQAAAPAMAPAVVKVPAPLLDPDQLLVAATAVTHLRASLRNPPSLSFATVLFIKKSSKVCFIYRAQNGFGGYNVEEAFWSPKYQRIINHDVVDDFRDQWNSSCAHRDGIDITEPMNSTVRSL
jgi:hypothetical protein